MQAVLDYIYEQPEPRRQLMLALHGWLIELPQLRAKISYGVPFYYGNSWVCYINPIKKNNHIELAFTRAHEFNDPTGLLQSNGRKQVKGIELSPTNDLPWEPLDEIMQVALDNDKRPHSKKRK